jgi:hypothetical protein
MFCTQYIPNLFEAEQYGLLNTSSWGSKDLALKLRFLNGILKGTVPRKSVWAYDLAPTDFKILKSPF